MHKLSARQELKDKFAGFQNRLYDQGTLAYIGKPDGTIFVPDRPGYIYVCVSDSPPVEVFNKYVAPQLGMPVTVGIDPYEPWILQVLKINTNGSDSQVGNGTIINYNNYSQVGPHAPTHMLLGSDPIWIDQRQLLMGRVGPAEYYNDSGELEGVAAIEIYPAPLYNGSHPLDIPYQVIDLTPYVPVNDFSKMVLVAVSASGSTVIIEGDAVAGNTPEYSDYPTIPSELIPLAYVRLYGEMTSVNENEDYTDIFDARLFLRPISSGGSGGSGTEVSNEPFLTYDDSSVLTNYRMITAGTGIIFTAGEGTLVISASGSSGAALGDVVGPASATNRAIAIYNNTTGKLIQNSLATIDTSGSLNIPTGQTYNINGSPHSHTGLVTNGNSHDHIGGDGAAITESALNFTDVTTANVTTAQHGLVPRAPNSTSQFLRGDGTWATVPASGSSGSGVTDILATQVFS
jgi:hypothetical protein